VFAFQNHMAQLAFQFSDMSWRGGYGQVVTCKPQIQSTVFDPDFYAIRASSSLQLVEVVAVQCDGHVATYSLHS
jgi:hypothetical protein